MRTLIVGLGAIGAGFGALNESENHASAAIRAGLKLVGGIDLNSERREHFISKYKCRAFYDFESAKNLDPEILVIAVDELNHKEVTENALRYYSPSIIIFEKPFGNSYSDSIYLLELCKARKIKIYVNYSRQFSEGFNELKKRIHGKLIHGFVEYNFGLRRSASHYLKLCIDLFGEPSDVKKFTTLYAGNENPSFTLHYGDKAKIAFTGYEDSEFRIGEMKFLTSNELVVIREGYFWELHKIAIQAAPFWPRNTEIIFQGNFGNGMSSLYSRVLADDKDLIASTSFSNSIPNKIIEIVNSYE